MPAKYIQNVKDAAVANPNTQVRLWIDTKRLTLQQIIFLNDALADAPQNCCIEDLRNIPQYCANSLFNESSSVSGWRDTLKTSIIWRQVDLAKVLVSLQGDYEQVFYSDMDYASIATDSPEIQAALSRHGLIIRGYILVGKAEFENQLWGFTRDRKPFFEGLYERTLSSIRHRDNGFMALVEQVRDKLENGEGLDTRELVYIGNHDGSSAHHPGYRDACGSASRNKYSELVYYYHHEDYEWLRK